MIAVRIKHWYGTCRDDSSLCIKSAVYLYLDCAEIDTYSKVAYNLCNRAQTSGTNLLCIMFGSSFCAE